MACTRRPFALEEVEQDALAREGVTEGVRSVRPFIRALDDELRVDRRSQSANEVCIFGAVHAEQKIESKSCPMTAAIPKDALGLTPATS